MIGTGLFLLKGPLSTLERPPSVFIDPGLFDKNLIKEISTFIKLGWGIVPIIIEDANNKETILSIDLWNRRVPSLIGSSELLELSVLLPGKSIDIIAGSSLCLEDLIVQLEDIGYKKSPAVTKSGQFFVRGSTLIVYPHFSNTPYRIETAFDKVIKIKAFKPDTNITGETKKILTISGIGNKKKKLKDILKSYSVYFFVVSDSLQNRYPTLTINTGPIWIWQDTKIDPKITAINIDASGTLRENRLDRFFDVIKNEIERGHRIDVFCRNTDELQFVYDVLERRGYSARFSDDFDEYQDSTIYLRLGNISHSFRSDRYNYCAINFSTILKNKRLVKKLGPLRKKRVAINPGAFVVHRQHGIGIFKRLVTKRFVNKEEEFLEIEYADEAKLFVPVTSIDQIRPYSSVSERIPKIDSLGRSAWKQRLKKAKRAAELLVYQLAELYSTLSITERRPYRLPEEFDEFMDRFPYEHTEDQKKAILDIINDLTETNTPMDRLITGDAGFGKSEVAHLASFIVAKNNRQILFMCPSTILASQHFEKAKERLSDAGIRIGLLCSFVSEKQQKKVISDFKSGNLDMLIGTHRLLSSDVRIKDPGLLIIDEEQNFGVKQKELFRKRYPYIDVLTLSATPIPRTLYMAASGLKNISVISTPPTNRIPATVHIISGKRSQLKSIIEKEIERGGQVFYLFNRIRGLKERADSLRDLLEPSVKVQMAHGRMDRDELEMIFWEFVEGKIDVLVSTTIIENGIDIPNANTIIIEGIENLGLAQLYQLKGRVGRGEREGRVYMIFNEDFFRNKKRSQKVLKRVEIIKELSEPGMGFRVAEADLELRGAGELLGEQQSGGISAVGIHMYLDLVKEAAQRLHGKSIRPPSFVDVKHPFSALLPKDYIENPAERLIYYEEIGHCNDESKLDRLQLELKELFGPLPDSVVNLFDTVRLKILASTAGIESIDISMNRISISFWEEISPDVTSVMKLITKENGRITPRGIVSIPVDKEAMKHRPIFYCIEKLSSLFSTDERNINEKKDDSV